MSDTTFLHLTPLGHRGASATTMFFNIGYGSPNSALHLSPTYIETETSRQQLAVDPLMQHAFNEAHDFNPCSYLSDNAVFNSINPVSNRAITRS